MTGRRQAKAASERRAERRSTHTLVWRYARLRIVVTPNYLDLGNTQLELIVVAPKGAPIPLTTTGYYCHYLGADQLAAAGGPVRFLADWLDREARSAKWQQTEFRWRQLDLFAEAKR